jgi:NarL family two-component system response regulator YdfI
VTRVLIGANSKNVRLDLASLLAAESRFKIVGKLSIESALDQLENLDPDVVILHLESSADESRLFGLDPPEIPLRPAFVILTDNAEIFPLDALRSADAVLPLGAKAEEIIATIDASSAGLVVFHRDVFNSLLLSLVGGEQPIDPSDRILTPRETEVLRMIADGLGNKEIASRLGISDHTVKFHISAILAKLGASNRAEAVTLGIREGLIMV